MKKSLWIAAVLLAACSDAPAPSPRSLPELGIENAVLVDAGLATSGQPTPEQLARLPEIGITRMIHLRPPDETGTGWEEERARELGLHFMRLPVAGPEDLTEANARALDRALAEARDEGVLLSCSSGNRSGGLLALRAYHCQGASPEEALALGKRAGMTRAEPAVRKALGLPPSD